MISQDMTVFIFSSTLMALGIGIDAAMATLIRARGFHNRTQASYWIAGVSVTHTVFPMLGYLLAYISVQLVPWLTPIVGVAAFILVGQFLYSELTPCDQTTCRPSNWVSFGLILAVSWDALWSGPAKSAQVLGWSDWMVWLSFIWVGLLVSALCVASYYAGRRILHMLEGQAYALSCAVWLQLSVIGYFGLLALFRYSFNWHIHELIIFMISGVFIYFLRLRQRYVRRSLA
ncbi:MAG: putative Mn2+ efflux pump MntP [Bermanella sp.]|jgi:putative Mn2+ efflux pump MntP